MTEWLVQYPPEVQLRFNGAVHAALLSLTDPLPLQARASLESFIVEVITMEEICRIAATPSNPPRLRASCYAMLVELHSWNLNSKRRKVLREYAMLGSQDSDLDVRREAIFLLGQINSDNISSRQPEDPAILEALIRLSSDPEEIIAGIADEILSGWMGERRMVEEVDAEIREMEREEVLRT